MPLKLISFLTTLILMAFFIGFNLENRCDVSFIFYTFKDVPIFVSLIFAFVAGAVAVIPFFIGARIRRSSKAAGKDAKNAYRKASPADSGPDTTDGNRENGKRTPKIRSRENPGD